MTLLKRLLHGGIYGLAFAGAWFLVEGLYLTVHGPQTPWWSFPLDLGVAAPLAFVAAIAAAAVFGAWSVMYERADPVHDAIAALGRWTWQGTLDEQAGRIGWVLATPALLAVWIAVGVWSGDRILQTVKTTAFAAALILVVALVAAVALAVGSAAVVVPLQRLTAWIGRRVGGRGVRAAFVLGAEAVLGVILLIVLWRTYPDVLPHLPWNFALAPIAGVLAVAALAHFSDAVGRRTPLVLAALAVPVVLLGILAAYLPQSLADGRDVFVGRTSVGGAWYGQLDKRLDYDHDGSIHLYGGNDCAPHDASRGPQAREIVGNGIDENCSGGDLKVNMADFSTGKAHHARPTKGIARRPNIILITTDALSFHHTSIGGYRRDTTPNLAKWAKHATVFDQAFSLGPSTRLAMPGLVAGTFNSMVPMKNGRIHPYEYAHGVPTLAETLKKHGYKTVFIPGHKYFLPGRWRGFTQGFDVVDSSAYHDAKDKLHTSPEVTAEALKYLNEQDDDKPLFLWVHYYDHHSPYRVPKGHRAFPGNKGIDRYDNELHYADSHWAQLIAAVEKKWKPDQYVIAFTSDHGEAFDRRHPHHHHGYTLDTPVVHVPFVVQMPTRRGERIHGLVTHADLVATFANLVGAMPAKSWVGESLTPVFFEGKEPEKQVVYSLFYIPEAAKRHEDGFGRISVRTAKYAYIENIKKGFRRLVDWHKDPVGDKNLDKKKPEVFEIYRYLAARKLEWLRKHEKALSFLHKKKKKARHKSEPRRAKKAAHK